MAIEARNIDISDLLNSRSDMVAKPADTDFSSSVGDFKEMTVGFIQACYSNLAANTGHFELWVGAICDENKLARHPGSKVSVDSECNSVSWNLCCIGFRFFQVRYTANGETAGTVDRIVAIGKKNG